MKLKLVFFSLFFCLLSNASEDIYQAIITKGFYEIENTHLLKNDYENLYDSFGKFIDCIENNTQLAEMMEHIEKDFLSNEELKKRYSSAPPSYRNPRKHATKRHDKVYFQFIKEHYQLIQEKYPELLKQYPVCLDFLNNMSELDRVSKILFIQTLHRLEKNLSGIKETMLGDYNDLTVISKIVRYEKSEKWGTTPHCDKSSLTLIWDSNDEDNDCLLVCEDSNNPSMASLKKPNRKYSHKDGKTSTLLIAGLALPLIGIDIKPTVHGVAPIKSEYRYAVISFMLVPHLDMTHLNTDFIEQQ